MVTLLFRDVFHINHSYIIIIFLIPHACFLYPRQYHILLPKDDTFQVFSQADAEDRNQLPLHSLLAPHTTLPILQILCRNFRKNGALLCYREYLRALILNFVSYPLNRHPQK